MLVRAFIAVLFLSGLSPRSALSLPNVFGVAPGTASLTLETRGKHLDVLLLVPEISLVGFEGAPKDTAERIRFRRAKRALETGAGLLRFATRAGCRAMDTTLDPDPGENRSDAAHRFSVRYRFLCENPEHLSSLAVGLFSAFPRLERVLVRYAIGGIRGEAELSRNRPLVSFVPLY